MEKELIISALNEMKTPFDETLGAIRDADHQQRNNSIFWMIKPFLRAAFNYEPLLQKDPGTLLTKLTSSSLFTHLGILGVITTSRLDNLAKYEHIFIITVAILYLVSVASNFRRQLIVTDPHFDISAFRMTERIFYNKIALKYINASPFTFSSLYEIYKDLAQQSLNQMEGLLTRLDEKTNRISILETTLSNSEIAVKLAKTNIDSYLKLMDHLNKTLLRCANGEFNKDDLMIGFDYSLFAYYNDDSLTLETSHGLTSTPKKIDLSNTPEHLKEYAVVYAYEDEEENMYEDVSHNRRVISKRYTMPDGTIYVYSFHFRSYQTENYDIIKTNEMCRTIYSLIRYWHKTYGIQQSGEELINESN